MYFHNVKILQVDNVSEEIKTFFLERPEFFDFLPGQFVWVSIRGYNPAPMAIASGTKEEFLMISVRLWGELTKEMFKLREGDTIQISHSQGTWFPNAEKIIAVAGGTGITPIRSVVKSYDAQVKVIHGSRDEGGFLFMEDIDAIRTLYVASEGWKGKVGTVADVLRELVDPEATYMIVGSKSIIESSLKVLTNSNIPENRIFLSLEKFVDNNVMGPVYSIEGLRTMKKYIEQLLLQE